MKVTYQERSDLIEFLVDLRDDQVDEQLRAKSVLFFNILKQHQVHKNTVKIHHKELKDFIVEVRTCQLSE